MINGKVMIVEDERIVALHSRQQLERLGYTVVASVSSGAQALARMEELKPDIILMDIHIDGDIDGIETVASIPGDLNIGVIYLTAYSEEATLSRAAATKPDGYLIKPYSERELHATIQMALERRRADKAAARSEERFRSIFNAVSEGIFILDADTERLVEVNEPGAAMLGYTVEELIDSNAEPLSSGTSPYTNKDVADVVARMVATGEPARLNWQNKTKAGRIFPTEVSMRFATIDGRNVVLSIVRDLTERQAMEDQLRQAQKMEAIGQLTGGMAHDFNNLLSVIMGNLEMLREKRPADEDIEDFAGEALDAARSGADLTQRLLAFARRQALQPQRIDLNELLAGTAKLLRRVLGESIEIELALADHPCLVLADRAQLEAAITNLATNARDAMTRGGKLALSTRTQTLDAEYAAVHADVIAGQYALVEVTDSGTGIPADIIDQIFDPFFTTKERDKGTGLGLSMVFGFMKQSGGHIAVYSEPGVGTTFRLYLPLIDGVATASEAHAGRPTRSRGETVLVVEDNTALRRIVVKQLEDFGYRVLAVSNATEAQRVLNAEKVDLLFTDVVMPGGVDGIELATRALKGNPGLRVLLTSGYPETKLKGDLAAASFRLLSKPYDRVSLERVVREILDGHSSSRLDGI